jgi:cobalamin synthase
VASREDWMRRLGPLYGGAVALVHSTPWRWPDAVTDEPRSPGWVVALGAPIGAAAWVISALVLAAGMPPTVAAVLAAAALTFGSAALVERGLAERVDRWQGHDAAGVGAGAIVALVLLTVLRIAALAAVRPDHWLGVLVATAVAGRWAGVFLQTIGEPISNDRAPRSLVASPSPAWLTAALGLAAAGIAVAALGKAGIAALAIAAAAAFALGLDAQRRDGRWSRPPPRPPRSACYCSRRSPDGASSTIVAPQLPSGDSR